MRSPPQIALEPLPQAHRVVMRIEKLIDHEHQHIALVVRESSAGGPGDGSVSACYQHDFSSNYTSLRTLSSARNERARGCVRASASRVRRHWGRWQILTGVVAS